MTAKEYLLQIRRCEKDIRRLEERITEIRELMYSSSKGSDNNANAAAGSREGSALENNVVRYVDRIAELDRKKKEKVQLKASIELQIMHLEDVRYVDILRYRYIDCMQWQEIANKTNYSIDWIKHIHKDALNIFYKKYKNIIKRC